MIPTSRHAIRSAIKSSGGKSKENRNTQQKKFEKKQNEASKKGGQTFYGPVSKRNVRHTPELGKRDSSAG